MKPTYPDDFRPLLAYHASEKDKAQMVTDVLEDPELISLTGDTLVIQSAGQIYVFALVTQAPIKKEKE